MYNLNTDKNKQLIGLPERLRVLYRLKRENNFIKRGNLRSPVSIHMYSKKNKSSKTSLDATLFHAEPLSTQQQQQQKRKEQKHKFHKLII